MSGGIECGGAIDDMRDRRYERLDVNDADMGEQMNDNAGEAPFPTHASGQNPSSLAWWRSPADQPFWARPALLFLTALAGVLYSWDATGNLEIYYAAAVRSMSMSWHDFFFAAFDPAGTVTLDKLPGAFWIQALSVRLFGVHAWAIIAPQIVEGMASVLVLHRVVRRLAGPLAGIVAALVLVLSPATVALDRGNISDTLMVLLLLLAADATVSAIVSGRMRSLLLAGSFVGLAFQAKMVEAWLVLPALALAYLLVGPGGRGSRLVRVGGAGLVVGAVSVSWMVVVALWPAGGRPYVDGSSGNSIFAQVFVYNGLGRVDQPSPNQLLTRAIGLPLGSAPAGWSRLLAGADGRDTGWLIPAALLVLTVCLVTSVRERNEHLLAASVLWGVWLVVLFIAFSASSTINVYYTAALSPAIAALLGTGLALAWERRVDLAARLALAAAVAVSCVYAVWLLPGSGVGLVPGLPEAAAVLGLVAIAALPLRARPLARAGAFVLAAAGIMAVPAVASIAIAAEGFGPFDTPFEPAASSTYARALGALPRQVKALLPRLEQANAGVPDLLATQTSAVAAPFIYDSGREVLPIGGYTGTIPEPSLAALMAMLSAGDFHTVVQAPKVSDPRLAWVARTCLTIDPGTGPTTAAGALRFAVYYCGRLPLPGGGSHRR